MTESMKEYPIDSTEAYREAVAYDSAGLAGSDIFPLDWDGDQPEVTHQEPESASTMEEQ